ncbi:class I SAM-dependent methyltransferase [Glycomyces sp. L485]|uniref:class I SAM-dependent methyltransferase n=1 Tax=Glycomyces sp. L485 TaxID=2909235 RepID=UPI001F4B8288|nr:class I SAM-dependent methyltransferase [Glycomyces sp. L485]MCH7230909.1 class I SAM-dependent methyltransferase [Glycomyces sp. L485]
MERRWNDYLDEFHLRRPGITERLLARARHGETNPYHWLAEAVPRDGTVLDLACGSAPIYDLVDAGLYIGLDSSSAELALAAQRGAPHLVQGSATALPFPDGSVRTVACSMALQILRPLPQVLDEISRVLAPDGRLAVTFPCASPLLARDYPLVAGLALSLGRRVGYPNDEGLRHLGELLASAGLSAVDDVARRFAFRLDDAVEADALFSSLYLPELPERRARAARAWLRLAAKFHAAVPIPIRRVLAVKPGRAAGEVRRS